ncbi:CvpA family protein [Hymenobacter lutimineralis]|uniref:CvpA family protein n=1 Tax=Hymenobacter lutimineralis TaxID=2606448 RepID=A0A5D6VAB8_9BACT|nr:MULTISPECIES: CvpA family protein [Hymenobacter]QIX62014.1 CvpA family protein [Hymenobacter sp. BT18]TYZ12476.1 CvpA family protein [Hymenobacter lutimineralis]
MSAFDILLLIPLGVGAVKGYRRGLVLEVASLLAFVLGAIGGLLLLQDAIPLVRHYVGEAFGMLPLVSFLLVFVLIVWGVHLLGTFIKTAVHLTPLGMLDNILGGTAGVLKWLLGLSLLLHGVGLAGLSVLSPGLVADSEVLPLVQEATPFALQVVGLVLPFASDLLEKLRGVF